MAQNRHGLTTRDIVREEWSADLLAKEAFRARTNAQFTKGPDAYGHQLFSSGSSGRQISAGLGGGQYNPPRVDASFTQASTAPTYP